MLYNENNETFDEIFYYLFKSESQSLIISLLENKKKDSDEYNEKVSELSSVGIIYLLDKMLLKADEEKLIKQDIIKEIKEKLQFYQCLFKAMLYKNLWLS